MAREGSLRETGDPWAPWQLVNGDGLAVEAAAAFLADLHAAGRSAATMRSYGMDLLRWFRFLWAAGVAWDRATRAEARDFCRWLQVAGMPARPHWRSRDEAAGAPGGTAAASRTRRRSGRTARRCCAASTTSTATPAADRYSTRSRWTAPGGAAGRTPITTRWSRTAASARGFTGRALASRIPGPFPTTEFNEIFARLPSHRDRALVAFYVSTGARASELLSATAGGVDPGRQLISVVRKGSRAVQELPASTDAFVWLRLYQVEMDGLIPRGTRQPLWWTLRHPFRPLTYHAVHRMFERVNERAGTAATLHSLRHTAAYRMAEDPALPLTDVQLVLGHAQLTTTQIYLTPRKEDVIRRLLAHHAEQTRRAAERVAPPPAPGYRPEALEILFGTAVS